MSEQEIPATAASASPTPPIENKQELVHKIRELLELEDTLAKLRKDIGQKMKERQALSTSLIEVMKKNEITSFDTKNSVIEFKVSHTKPMGKRILNQLLSSFYQDNTEAAEGIKKFIAENAPVRTKEKLVRKIKAVPPAAMEPPLSP